MYEKEAPKFVQITSSEAYYTDRTGVRQKHLTLFALDGHGRIWTRYYDGEKSTYREWYTLSNSTVP